MQVNRNKFLNILLILQTALATLTQTRSEDLAEETKTEVLDFIDDMNFSCQNDLKRYESYVKMQECFVKRSELMDLPELKFNHTKIAKYFDNDHAERLANLKLLMEKARSAVYKCIDTKCIEKCSIEKDHQVFQEFLVQVLKEIGHRFSELERQLCKLSRLRALHDIRIREDPVVMNLLNTNTRLLKQMVILASFEICLNHEGRELLERVEDFEETIGCDLIKSLHREFKLLKETKTGDDHETLYNQFAKASNNLETVFAYFEAYREYSTALSLFDGKLEFVDVRETICKNWHDLETERNIDRVLRRTKLNELRFAFSENESKKESDVFINDLGAAITRDLQCHFYDLAYRYSEFETRERFISLFHVFKQGDESLNNQPIPCRSDIPSTVQPFYDAFIIHFHTYHNLLLVAEAYACEKDLASAKLTKMTIQLKQAIYKARKALHALSQMNESVSCENDESMTRKLTYDIVKSVCSVIAMKKMNDEAFNKREKNLEAAKGFLNKRSEELRKLIPNIGHIEEDVGYLDTVMPNPSTVSNDTEKFKETFSLDQYLKNFVSAHKEINKNILDLANERKNKGSSDTDDDTDVVKLHVKKKIDLDSLLDDKLGAMDEKAYGLAKEFHKISKEAIAQKHDHFNGESYDLCKKTAELLYTLAHAHFISEKKVKLKGQLTAADEQAKIIFDNLNMPDQIKSVTIANLKSLGTFSDYILANASEKELFVSANRLICEFKDAAAMCRTERGKTEAITLDKGKFNLCHIFLKYPLYDKHLMQIAKQTNALVNNFLAVHQAKIEVYKDMKEIVNNKTDEAVIVLADYILGVFEVKNDLHDNERLKNRMKLLQGWIGGNGDKIIRYIDEIIGKTGGLRISMPLLAIINSLRRNFAVSGEFLLQQTANSNTSGSDVAFNEYDICDPPSEHLAKHSLCQKPQSFRIQPINPINSTNVKPVVMEDTDKFLVDANLVDHTAKPKRPLLNPYQSDEPDTESHTQSLLKTSNSNIKDILSGKQNSDDQSNLENDPSEPRHIPTVITAKSEMECAKTYSWTKKFAFLAFAVSGLILGYLIKTRIWL